MTRNKTWLKITAVITLAVFLCNDIAAAGNYYNLASPSLFNLIKKYDKTADQKTALKASALDEFLKDKATREGIFLRKGALEIPGYLSAVFSGFFSVIKGPAVDANRAQFDIILNGKDASLYIFADPGKIIENPAIGIRTKSDIAIARERGYWICFKEKQLEEVEEISIDVLNVACGTVCEKGHEGSYDALDSQLKRQFSALRQLIADSGQSVGERDLSEGEADRALVEYAKRFGIKITVGQLREYRREIIEIDEALRQINIYFSIPETGTELFWVPVRTGQSQAPSGVPSAGLTSNGVKYDYAGGHFNKKGTRIHVSLPIILKRGIQVGMAIVRHELAHIQGKEHQDDEGMGIVRKIAEKERPNRSLAPVIKTKKEALQWLNENDWNLNGLYKLYYGKGLNRFKTYKDLLEELSIAAEFKEEAIRAYRRNYGRMLVTSDAFGTTRPAFWDLLRIYNTRLTRELLQDGDLLYLSGHTKRYWLGELEKCGWNFVRFREIVLSVMPSKFRIFLIDAVKGLDLRKEVMTKITERFRGNACNLTETAKSFGFEKGTDVTQLMFLAREIGLDLSKTRHELFAAAGMTRGKALLRLKKNNWNLGELRNLIYKGKASKRHRYVSVIRGLGIEKEFEKEFLKQYRRSLGAWLKLDKYFGIKPGNIKRIIKGLNIELPSIISKEDVIRWITINGWNLRKLWRYVYGREGGQGSYGYSFFIDDLGIAKEFKKEFLGKYILFRGVWKKLIRHFGLPTANRRKLMAILRYFEIKLPELKQRRILLDALGVTKKEALAFIEENKWNLKKIRKIIAKRTGLEAKEFGYYSFIIRQLGVEAEFRSKYKEIYFKCGKRYVHVGIFFGITSNSVNILLKELGINEEEFKYRHGYLLRGWGLNKKDILDILEKNNWNLKELRDFMKRKTKISITYPVLIEGLDIYAEFREILRDRYFGENFFKRVSISFGIQKGEMKRIIKYFDIDLSQRPKEKSRLLESIGMSKEEVLAWLRNNNWNLYKLRQILTKKMKAKVIKYEHLIKVLNIEKEFAEKYLEVYEKNRGVLRRIAIYFGLRGRDVYTLGKLAKKLQIDVSKIRTPGMDMDEMNVSILTDISREKILEILGGFNWNLRELKKYLAKNYVIRKGRGGNVSYAKILRDFDIVREFVKKHKTAMRLYSDKLLPTARRFGITDTTLKRLLGELGIKHEEVSDSEEEERFKQLMITGDIERLLYNFGLASTYKILIRVHEFTPVSLGKFLARYRDFFDKEGDVVKNSRKKKEFSPHRIRKTTLFKTMAKEDVDILADEIIASIYPRLVEDYKYMEKILVESENPENSPLLQEAYRRAYQYYKDAAGIEIKGINEKNITLKFYQKIGIKILLGKKRAILADEPGLGKTIQAIGAALNANSGRGAEKILIIAPNSAKEFWKREIEEKTTGREYVYIVPQDPLRHKGTFKRAKQAKFVIVNYEAIRGKNNKLREDLKKMGFDFIIVDEAHRMRNESLQTEAVTEFDAPYKILVSGTPLIGRKIGKIFNLLNWLYPEVYNDRKAFSLVYGGTAQRLRRLKEDLSRFMIRRYKRDVMPDIPDKVYISVQVELGERQRAVYERIRKEFNQWLARHLEKKSVSSIINYVITKLTKLKQAAIDTSLVEKSVLFVCGDEKVSVPIDADTVVINGVKYSVSKTGTSGNKLYFKSRKEEFIVSARGMGRKQSIRIDGRYYDVIIIKPEPISAKYEVLDRLMSEIIGRGEKVVIFTNYLYVLTDLKKRYKKYGVNYISGQLKSLEQRQSEIDSFQNNPDIKVFISTIPTGGESITLHAANNVIFVDMPWTPQEKEQAIDRIHRIGQGKRVNIYSLVAKGTVDEYILDVLNEAEIVFRLSFDEDPSVDKINSELIERVMGELKYPEEIIQRMKNFRIGGEKKDTSKTLIDSVRDESEPMYISFKNGEFICELRDKNMDTVLIKGIRQLFMNSEKLSEESKKLIRMFFTERIRSEAAVGLKTKETIMWYLFSEMVPGVKKADYSGDIEPIVEAASLIIERLLKHKDLTLENLSKIIKNESILNKTLYYLDRYNIFKALSHIGVLEKQYYYNGNLLTYTPPIKIFSVNENVLYIDRGIVESIAPNRTVAIPKEINISEISSIELSRLARRKLTRDEEVRLAGEAEKGNIFARDELIADNLDLVIISARAAMKKVRAQLSGVAAQISIEDLYSEGLEILTRIIEEYYPVRKDKSLDAFASPILHREIIGIAFSKAKEYMQEKSVLDEPIYDEEGSLLRKDFIKSVEIESDESEEEKVELLGKAQKVLTANGFNRTEIDIFIDYLGNVKNSDIAKANGLSVRMVKEVIDDCLECLKISLNVACGTVCEKGHEGSYDALDSQLKRQFSALRQLIADSGESIGERDLSGDEADRTLVEYAKRFGIKITVGQLREYRREIIEIDEALKQINIYFSIPETGTELFWVPVRTGQSQAPSGVPSAGLTSNGVKYDYAGGHFNKKGTRIHVSLPIILKRGIEAGRAIARHELKHIEGKSHEDGLCVTGDTLLPILSAKEIQNTPIVDVKFGDYVLSLNEETQMVEPHRINGLLDMGVKPVYRLTTAGGRSIKTTANHPYYVKADSVGRIAYNEECKKQDTVGNWTKVSELKAGDEIGVPELSSFVKNEDCKIDYQKQTCNDKKDSIVHGNLPLAFHYPDKNNQGQYAGKNVKSQKIHVFFASILDNLTAMLKNNIVMAMPIENVSQGILPAASGTNTPTTNEANINFAPSRKKSDTTSNLSFDNIQFDVTTRNIFVNENVKNGDICWDRIASIEYLGYLHVYDIEVEGTHNFIGNGIFAHNTYIQGGRRQDDEGIRIVREVAEGERDINRYIGMMNRGWGKPLMGRPPKDIISKKLVMLLMGVRDEMTRDAGGNLRIRIYPGEGEGRRIGGIYKGNIPILMVEADEGGVRLIGISEKELTKRNPGFNWIFIEDRLTRDRLDKLLLSAEPMERIPLFEKAYNELRRRLNITAEDKKTERTLVTAAYYIAKKGIQSLNSSIKVIDIFTDRFGLELKGLDSETRNQLIIAVYNVAMKKAEESLERAIDTTLLTSA